VIPHVREGVLGVEVIVESGWIMDVGLNLLFIVDRMAMIPGQTRAFAYRSTPHQLVNNVRRDLSQEIIDALKRKDVEDVRI
jgi:hypothetical protein